MLQSILSSLLDTVSKRKCQICLRAAADSKNAYACKACEIKLVLDFASSQKQTVKDSATKVFFVSLYQGRAKRLIRRLKYEDPFLYRFWARLLVRFWLLNKELIDAQEAESVFYVTAIPMSNARKKNRKYNPADLLAQNFVLEMEKILGTRSKFMYLKDILVRVKDTEQLFSKSKEERSEILEDAFAFSLKECSSMRGSSPKLIIIDDITTTGTTFYQATSVIQKTGVFDDLICLACAGNNI